jgi:hypothetical protein
MLYYGAFPKTSVFGKATLDLAEKAGFGPLLHSLSRNQPDFGKGSMVNPSRYLRKNKGVTE